MRLASTLVLALVATLACGGTHRAEPALSPIPGVAPDSALLVRGTAAAAGALNDEDQSEIVSHVLRSFYYPPDKQARWLDPRPLAHLRLQAADDTVGTDPDFADEVVAATKNSRICVLAYRDFGCRGKTGGIVRFSWPYRTGKDSAVVFAIYTARDSLGVSGSPKPEMQFRLKWNSDGAWEMVGNRAVSAKPSPSATRP